MAEHTKAFVDVFTNSIVRYNESHCSCDRSEEDECKRCEHPLEDHAFHSMFCLACDSCHCYVCPRCGKDHPGL